MRRIKIAVHPLSLLIGAACAVAVSFAASPVQVSQVSNGVPRVAVVNPVTVRGIPTPESITSFALSKNPTGILPGSYTVPLGKTLVVAQVEVKGDTSFTVDGAPPPASTTMYITNPASTEPEIRVPSIPLFAVPEGSIIETHDSTNGIVFFHGWLQEAP